MRYGIIADIHSNLEALEAVLSDLSGKVDQIICLGDIIGYGPNPNECCEIFRDKKIPSIAGNHEKGVLGEMSLEWFNPNASEAVRWTKRQLLPENLEYLKGLPLTMEYTEFQLVHGSLINPTEEYLNGIFEAMPTFDLMVKPLLFVGHTHQPLNLNYKEKEIVNPGSVGQSRDGNPMSSYLVFDSEKKEFNLYRVKYDIEKVQQKMMIAGLPQFLIDRLTFGR